MKRERWTEADILSLPAEEPDQFDRKSGLLLKDEGKFLDALAKALSAFANSGGGSLIIGVDDRGQIDGVEPCVGRASFRDWLEQKIPHLVDYPISDFRVHTVEPDTSSQIPSGKVVVVVDVGDSALAPHQTKRDKIYYHRQGGRSVPAPHFYLELLRNRLTGASLEFRLLSVTVFDANRWQHGVNMEMVFEFEIKNTGRIAAYKWSLQAETLDHPAVGATPALVERYQFGRQNFLLNRGGVALLSLDDTILPGNRRSEKRDVAVFLPTPTNLEQQIDEALTELVLGYRLATEMSPGTIIPIALRDVVDIKAFAADVERLLDEPPRPR